MESKWKAEECLRGWGEPPMPVVGEFLGGATSDLSRGAAGRGVSVSQGTSWDRFYASD